MKCNDVHFVIEMTESYLDLVLFVLWNDYTFLEACLPDGKNAMCLRYSLRIVTPSLSVHMVNSK